MSDATTTGGDDAGTETISDRGRDPFDELAEEFAERCRRGEPPSIDEFAARHPAHAAKIRTLLPTVALMEQLKRGSQRAQTRASGGEPDLPIPERLGEYRVLRELGRGGMGIVYEAVQESLGRHVALKVIPHVHLDAKRLQRFRRESQAVAQIHHTHIVPIFGVGEHEGLPYYVMQYIQGSGLDVLLGTWRRQGSSPDHERWRFVARVGVQAARALQYAHEQGVLHRDIKPANLLIDEHDAVWITDFGLAKLTGHDDLTASGDVVGTLRYLAPEALRGETDARSDVYSLGLTLYELLTLNPPFGELSPSELLHRVSEGEPARPRTLDPGIPRDLETIVLKAIVREPNQRYATAAALADDLECFLADRPIRARRATAFERLWRWSRRNRATAALAATAAGSLLLAAIIGWAGYASTARALRRSDENVALSLEVFGELFERLAAHDNLSPPPLGHSVREGPPGRGPEPGTRPPRDGPPWRQPPPPHDRGDDHDPFAPGPPPMDGPPGAPRRRNSEDDTALLRSVLTFYDRFSRQNATNLRLQGEAAWAYRKVGALYEHLGREAEAEQAYARAIEIFEGLVARYPDDPDYRIKLVGTFDMADPWSAAPATLGRLEQRLRRAQQLSDQLAALAPDNIDYAQARVHIYSKLPVTLERLKRFDEAAAGYRQAIALEDELIERWPRNTRLRVDRAVTREALALFQLERGQRDDALTLLDGAAADLQSFASGNPPPPPERIESLAAVYRRLGATQRAQEMDRWADEASSRRRPRPGPGRGPGPRPRWMNDESP